MGKEDIVGGDPNGAPQISALGVPIFELILSINIIKKDNIGMPDVYFSTDIKTVNFIF
jgi:hypothetical protein